MRRPAWITIARGPQGEGPFRRGELLHTDGGEYLLVLRVTDEAFTFERHRPTLRLLVASGPHWWLRFWWLVRR